MSDKLDRLKNAFPSIINPVIKQDPVPQSAPQPVVPSAPVRTVGNIYLAAQAQTIYNPGTTAPPDPTTGATVTGPVGNSPNNQAIKAPAPKQVDQGTVGSLAPETGWGKTNA